MIKINKFNNVYEIKELKNTDLINGNTLIYAPNGVMKTSFSDGLRDIISGDMPKDVFTNPNILSEFELENNGIIVSSNDSNFSIDAFVFNSNDYNNDIFSDPRMGSLVMSSSLKVKYKTILDKYLKVKNDFNSLISKDVLGRKKVDENDFNFLSNIFGSNDFVKVLEGLSNLNEYTDEYYENITYLDLFNEKVEAIISSSEFIDKCNNYNSYIDIELDKEVFNSGFSFDSLQKILKEFKTNNFFKAGHKVSLKSKGEMGENELLNYINSIVKKVYGSDEAQKLFNEAKAVLDKNPNTRKLISTIKEKPRHLKEISNLTNFKKNIIFTKMNGHKDYIDNLRKELEDYRNALEEIIKESESATETWKKVLDNYNSRFITNKFDVEIENLTDAVLNLKPPATSINDNNITYIGKNIEGYGEYTYKYNEQGIRVNKSKTNYNIDYIIENNKIVKTKETKSGIIKSVEYHYDEHDMLVGLTYNDKEYFYDRDVLGNINRIIDITGKEYIRYKYTAYGEVIKEINSSLTTSQKQIANTLKEINIFLYKGYCYDEETNLYYCNSRYYSPILCRWITPDNADYLDPESINGMNIYCYCVNNPVMFSDGSGCSPLPWWGKLLIGIGVVIVGAVVTALTAGTGAGFMAAFGAALLTSAKAVAVSTAISAGIGLAMGGLTTGTWDGAINGMLEGAVDGFMWGGIFAGGAQILSGGFKTLAKIGINTSKQGFLKIFTPNRLRNANEIAKIANKGQKFYEYGGTVLKVGKNMIDISNKTFLHMHLWFTGAKHIPLGTIMAGIIGGFR